MANTAVLIIDVQNGPFNFPPEVYRGEETLEAINRLIDLARFQSMPVIFIQHDGPSGSVMEPLSENWQLHPVLHKEAGDRLVRKTASDAFYATELDALLKGMKVDHLLLCGFATEFCVDTTARRAASLGYGVTLVADAHTTKDRAILTAEQIVAHHNWLLQGLVCPGEPIQVKAVSEL